LRIDTLRQAVSGDVITVHNLTRQTSFSVSCPLSDRQRQILLAGGLLNYTKGGN
jgi:aconitate hydratase